MQTIAQPAHSQPIGRKQQIQAQLSQPGASLFVQRCSNVGWNASAALLWAWMLLNSKGRRVLLRLTNSIIKLCECFAFSAYSSLLGPFPFVFPVVHICISYSTHFQQLVLLSRRSFWCWMPQRIYFLLDLICSLMHMIRVRLFNWSWDFLPFKCCVSQLYVDQNSRHTFNLA